MNYKNKEIVYSDSQMKFYIEALEATWSDLALTYGDIRAKLGLAE